MSRKTLTSLKQQVYARAKGLCEICGRESQNLDVEHFRPLESVEPPALDSLLLVCASCNQRLHKPGSESISDIKVGAMQAYEFERAVVADLGKLGFALLTEVTGADAGVDIVARRQDPKTKERFSVVVQCKSTQRPLSITDMRILAEKCAAYRGDVALMVVNQVPSPKTLEQARRLGVRLTTLDDLGTLASSFWGKKNA